MKSLLIISAFLFIIGCGSGSDQKSTSDSTSKTEVKDPEVAKGLALITNSDCFSCHKLNETSSGPSYSSIALKYKSITPATMDSMVTQIYKGGSGKWGFAAMPPHPAISKEHAESMVHYIMSIKPN